MLDYLDGGCGRGIDGFLKGSNLCFLYWDIGLLFALKFGWMLFALKFGWMDI